MIVPLVKPYGAVAVFIAAGGRYATFNGRATWRTVYGDASYNCAHLDGKHSAMCVGWIAPVLGRRECVCPCHDAYRMPFERAAAIVSRRTNGSPAADHGSRTAGVDAR